MPPRPAVALVSRSNAAGGGASRVAEELAAWLHAAGARVVHYCAFPAGPLKPFQAPLFPTGLASRLARTTHRLTRRLGFNELVPSEFHLTLRHALRTFDVIHFHDLHSAIAPETLELCSREKPVVFTAHDCSCFTGGCIYPLACERHRANCGSCPQLPAIGARFDFTPLNLRRQRRLARQRRVQYVFPSRWLRDAAARSLPLAREPALIPYGFTSSPDDFPSQTEARRTLGIRDERRVVLVAAHYLADPRKGVAFALAALLSVVDLAPLVLFVGLPPSDLEVRLPGVQFWLTGFINDRRRLGLLYAAADVFLFPTLEDNLPIMVQEALAAGTPVVGFAAGGVPEMVDHDRTGWLCPPGDQSALDALLRQALTRDDLATFGAAARETVRTRYDADAAGEKHLALYAEVQG